MIAVEKAELHLYAYVYLYVDDLAARSDLASRVLVLRQPRLASNRGAHRQDQSQAPGPLPSFELISEQGPTWLLLNQSRAELAAINRAIRGSWSACSSSSDKCACWSSLAPQVRVLVFSGGIGSTSVDSKASGQKET